MKIIEDLSYTLEDIIDQIQEAFGFVYTSTGDSKGYILLDNQTKLNLEISEGRLDRALIVLPSPVVDISVNTVKADIYQSSIESAIQVVELINTMLGGASIDEEDN